MCCWFFFPKRLHATTALVSISVSEAERGPFSTWSRWCASRRWGPGGTAHRRSSLCIPRTPASFLQLQRHVGKQDQTHTDVRLHLGLGRPNNVLIVSVFARDSLSGFPCKPTQLVYDSPEEETEHTTSITALTSLLVQLFEHSSQASGASLTSG